MEKNMEEWTVCAFTVTYDRGTPVGFLASVMIDHKLRGKGYGKEVTRMALRYAFEFTGAESVQLTVFEENADAKRCYERIGFTDRGSQMVHVHEDETWRLCTMAISKQ